MTSKGAGMMRKGILLIVLVTAVAFVAAAAWAAAPTISFPMKAVLYKTTFVGAMEPCNPTAPGVVTLHRRGTAGGMRELLGCAPVASDSLTFEKGQLLLKKHSGKIIANIKLGTANATKQVAVRLVLNSSRRSARTFEGTEKEITYLPLELTCPTATADSKGHIVQTTYLDVCVPTSGLAVDPILPGPPGGTEEKAKVLDLNIEVLDAVLIDVATGNPFARAGVAR